MSRSVYLDALNVACRKWPGAFRNAHDLGGLCEHIKIRCQHIADERCAGRHASGTRR